MTPTAVELRPEVRQNLDAVLESLSPADLGLEMAARLAVDVPEMAELDDPDFRSMLVYSCSDNLLRIWELLGSADPINSSLTPPTGATAFAHELAHRGLPLSVLLRAYRLGHGYAERRLAETTAERDMPAEVRWELLSIFTQLTFEYIDAVCTRLVEDYEQERARWVRGAAAARAEYVQAIVERRPVEATAATERLGYDVSRRHLAFILWTDSPDPSQRTGRLERSAIDLAAALGGGPTLTIPVGERVVWAWTSGENLNDHSAGPAIRLEAGLRAAIGTVGDGPIGMAASHEDAAAVRRASSALGQREGSVLGYRACSLMTLLTSAPDRAIRFVETELGELGADDDVARRLRATVRVYLEEGLSPARTARRLSIHVNTVVYRVKQAEAVLGRPVDQRRLELEAALRLAERLPALSTPS